MTSGQAIIIVLFSSLTGLFIGWITIKFLFWPARPVSLGKWTIQGIIPASQKKFAHKAGQFVQAEFMAYKGLDEKIADPMLIAKLRPEIEDHVDHFLNEKIKIVFPVLAQFMGEKTITQFKTALLTEIDNLLPVLLKNYSAQLKNEIKPGEIVEVRVNALEVNRIKDIFYSDARKHITRFKILCTVIAFMSGTIAVLINYLFNM